jgi:isochorismate pyruvate lyase
MTVHHDLSTLRDEIDTIDCSLVKLLAQRFRTVDRVISTKRCSRIPAHIQSRVDEVIRNAEQNAVAHNLPPHSIRRLWEVLVDETIRYERNQGVSDR